MKVSLLGVLISFLAISAVSKLEVLSAAGVPQTDEKKSEESSSSNEAVANVTATTKTIDKSSSSENASVEDASSDTLPPLEFPSDDALPKNETALKILQSVSSQSSKSTKDSKSTETSTEVILSVAITTSSTAVPSSTFETVTDKSTNSSSNATTTEEDYDDLSEENEKNDAENIQENDNKMQEELEEEFAKTGSDKATINMGEDPVLNTPVLHSGHIALIFASTLIILSVVAYVGLILWRGRLEHRYGMRQRLVTEDDFYNNNDVRYFGL